MVSFPTQPLANLEQSLYAFITCLCEIKRFDWLKAEGNNMFRMALPRNDF